jgi:hypothetical protein
VVPEAIVCGNALQIQESLYMQVAYVAQLLSRVITDQVCESTSSLTIEFSEHDKMKQEVQWIYYSYFHVDVKTCYV